MVRAFHPSTQEAEEEEDLSPSIAYIVQARRRLHSELLSIDRQMTDRQTAILSNLKLEHAQN